MREYKPEQVKEVHNPIPKKTYTAPEINKTGNVKELTLGGGSQFFDEGGVEPLF